MKSFSGRIVVITGAGSGIGRATAHAFARAGAIVHVVDVHRSRAEEVAGELHLLGTEVHLHVLDVRDPSALEALAEDVYRRHARTDVLVNNAGVAHSGFVHETRLEDWKWVLDVNLWGVIHGTHAFAPRMIDQESDAHIVNTASIAGLVGMPTMAPYSASKFAVVGISESLGAELAPHGIRVTAVCPGVIDTDIVRAGRMPGEMAHTRRRIADFYRSRGIAPERVAKDILSAVRSGRPMQLSLGSAYAALLLKRLSPRLFRSAASFAQRKMLVS